jgi:hypothetical protein
MDNPLNNDSMKRLIFLLLIMSIGKLQAQFNESSSTLKFGSGYTHDFPGLNGYTLATEYIVPVTGPLQAGLGIKYANLNGYPRTTQVHEFTRAATLDFTLYWLPVRTDNNLLRIGLGYSFSFYDIKRSYPVSVEGDTKAIVWNPQSSKGRTSGVNLVAEYEYQIPNSVFSIGLRGALYKAYDRTYFIGPMLGMQL